MRSTRHRRKPNFWFSGGLGLSTIAQKPETPWLYFAGELSATYLVAKHNMISVRLLRNNQFTLFPTTAPNYLSDIGLLYGAIHRQATVTFVNGQKVTTENLHFGPDSTTWVVPSTRQVVAIPTTDVANVRFIQRGKGALQGAGIGLAGGALFGVVVGLSSGGDSFFTEEEIALIGGVYFGLLGGLVGLPVGAIIGSKDVYNVKPEDRPSSRAPGTTTSVSGSSKPGSQQSENDAGEDE